MFSTLVLILCIPDRKNNNKTLTKSKPHSPGTTTQEMPSHSMIPEGEKIAQFVS